MHYGRYSNRVVITSSSIQFVKQLEKITQYGGFALVKGETAIYSVGGEYDGDYNALLDAAHKARCSTGCSAKIRAIKKGASSKDSCPLWLVEFMYF